MRQKIASDLHDDIGSTLNSISVYSEIAGKQIETDSANARSLLQKMVSLQEI
jgi:signal transduction histidine kinase